MAELTRGQKAAKTRAENKKRREALEAKPASKGAVMASSELLQNVLQSLDEVEQALIGFAELDSATVYLKTNDYTDDAPEVTIVAVYSKGRWTLALQS